MHLRDVAKGDRNQADQGHDYGVGPAPHRLRAEYEVAEAGWISTLAQARAKELVAQPRSDAVQQCTCSPNCEVHGPKSSPSDRPDRGDCTSRSMNMGAGGGARCPRTCSVLLETHPAANSAADSDAGTSSTAQALRLGLEGHAPACPSAPRAPGHRRRIHGARQRLDTHEPATYMLALSSTLSASRNAAWCACGPWA